jgi:hypothetical protein
MQRKRLFSDRDEIGRGRVRGDEVKERMERFKLKAVSDFCRAGSMKL